MFRCRVVVHRSTAQATEVASLSRTRAAMARLVSLLPAAPNTGPSSFVPICPSPESCTPKVVADGSDVILSASGGTVTINTGECGAVDPCRSKANIEFVAGIRDALEALRGA